jgi:restriction endonuclease S subunit
MGIVREAVERINVSLPSIPIQNKIAEEVKQRILRAKKLQKEAEKDIKEAKEKVERIILREEEI